MQQLALAIPGNADDPDSERSLLVNGLPPHITEALLLQELFYRPHVVKIRIFPDSNNGFSSMKAIVLFENSHFAAEQLKLTPCLKIGEFNCLCVIQPYKSLHMNVDIEEDNSEERRSRRGKRQRLSVGEVSAATGSRRSSKRSNKSMVIPDAVPLANGLSGWLKEKQMSLRVPLTSESVISRVESLSQQNMHQAAYIYFLEHMELITNKDKCEQKLNELLANVRQHWLSLSPRVASNAHIGSPVHVSFAGGHILVQKGSSETMSSSSLESPSSRDSGALSSPSSSHIAGAQEFMACQSPYHSHQSSPGQLGSLSSHTSPSSSPVATENSIELAENHLFHGEKLEDSAELAILSSISSRHLSGLSMDSMSYDLASSGEVIDNLKIGTETTAEGRIKPFLPSIPFMQPSTLSMVQFQP
jgi:hypothetical protein